MTTDPLAAHDRGCSCWPHVGRREALEAVMALATEEYRAGKRAATPPAIDPDRLARAWWTAVNEPEDGPWLDASDDQRADARAWAAAIIAAYEADIPAPVEHGETKP